MLRPGDAQVVDAAPHPPLTLRPWLAHAHRNLEHLLPPGPPALLTDDMIAPGGGPADVFAHFGWRFEDMDRLAANFEGLLHTTHLAAVETFVERRPPPWEGFEDIWIPIGDGLELSGRMGWATDQGERLPRDCIVILPGLLGDNGVLRTRDLAIGLRSCGYHVLAVELRACGQTQARFPTCNVGWGIFETGDLLVLSQWLESQPGVRRTGLVGFCWGANIALLTAWADGRADEHLSITPQLAPFIDRPAGRHYTAGVIAFSPALRFEELIEQLETERSAIREPALYAFQHIVSQRMMDQGYAPVTGSLRQLIVSELEGYHLGFPDPIIDGIRYLRLLPHRGKPDGDKLEDARVPVLIVHAANDPLNSAQHLADLIAQTANPNVAGLILPGGGHVGFAAYARSYYFSLILNFFDAARGPQAVESAQVAG